MIIENGIEHPRVGEAVLFPFDHYSIPYQDNLSMHLIHGKKNVKKTPIVLHNGEVGQPDEHVHYYGTTMRIDDELRMWYIGRTGRDENKANYEGLDGQICYAVSRDGIHWEKPDLGLVDHHGSKKNNLVDFPEPVDVAAAVIIHDVDDPDPKRRFKCHYEAGSHGNRMCVAYSADGLRWTAGANNPVGPTLEQSGLIRYNGCYFVNGQGHGYPGPGRKLETFASYDFDHWTPASALGLNRSPLIEGPSIEDRARCWEEVHLGAALHDRGNVILGIYGMWHGEPHGDRRYLTMDLGLLISHDGVHFDEPIPGFRFIPAAEEHESTVGFGPALVQGQGMEPVGDQTYYWYSLWRIDGQVRLATWQRDRFGYVQTADPRSSATCITCPIRGDKSGARVFLNVSGLGEHTAVRVDVLDKQFRPIGGYHGSDSVLLRESGLRVPVRWREHERLPDQGDPVRLRIDFGSIGAWTVRPEDAKLYAVYVA